MSLDKVFDPKASNVDHAWTRARFTKSLIEVCRLAVENDGPCIDDKTRLGRVGEVLRIAEYLADLVEDDAFEMQGMLERAAAAPGSIHSPHNKI